jgi:hypothetical protein
MEIQFLEDAMAEEKKAPEGQTETAVPPHVYVGGQVNLDDAELYREHVKSITDDHGRLVAVLPIGKHNLWSGPAMLVLPKDDDVVRGCKHVAAQGNVPAYDLYEIGGVKVHARDGLKPNCLGNLVGRVEINVRVVQKRDPETDEPIGSERHFLSINVFPGTIPPLRKVVIRRKRVKGAKWIKKGYNPGWVHLVSMSFGLPADGGENGK